jgi:hypothetical protein
MLYIHDMPEGIKSTVRLCADDTIVYLTISSDKDSNDLQNDLDKLALWEAKWKMDGRFYSLRHVVDVKQE